jgi:hypothetical protein
VEPRYAGTSRRKIRKHQESGRKGGGKEEKTKLKKLGEWVCKRNLGNNIWGKRGGGQNHHECYEL